MTDAARQPLCFGTVELRPEQRLVLVGGEPAPLGARAFDVLMALVQHRDRIVSKHELLDQVWPDVVVEENNLQVQISTLRKLLGPQAIATVPGRGYRFTALPTAAAAAVPLAAGRPAHGNLPPSAPRLVGRDAETADVVHQARAHRIVTIVGAGGIGKTQLALAAAHALRDAFEHGAWLVDLSSVADGSLVATAIAQALALSLPSAASTGEALASALHGRELLLVLDNCEHLVQAVGPLVETVVRSTALVRVLATSQERLRIADEQLFRIAPLGIPASDTLGAAAGAGAVSLFVQRVQAVQAGFELDDRNVAAVVEICRQLDGLPLAIELAAARTPLLGVAGVRDRLGDRFRVLTAGTRTAGPRHQTLRQMLEWSFGLLGEEERTVFTRAGAFVGSFSLDAAQAVLADEGIDPWSVLDLLGSLVDKSLVVSEPSDPPRLRLLETMRAYALERLQADPAEAARVKLRHARAMVGLLRAGAEAEWTVPSQVRLARMLPELDNVRAALAWALRMPDTGDLHVELAGWSAWMWLLANLRVEGLSHLEAALQRVGPQTPAPCEARLLTGWATLRFPAAGPQERAALDRAMALFGTTTDRRGQYACCFMAIRAAAVALDHAASRDRLSALEALHDPAWPPVSRWDVLTARFYVRLFSDTAAVASVLPELEEGLRLAWQFGDVRLRALSLMYLEQATEVLGQYEAAVQRGQELLELLRDVPFTLLRPMALNNLCLSLTHLDRLDEALEYGREALAAHRVVGTQAMVMDSVALLAFKRGRLEAAAKALGRADASVLLIHGARQPNEARAREIVHQALLAALGSAELQRLMQAGTRLSEDEAARLALDVRA